MSRRKKDTKSKMDVDIALGGVGLLWIARPEEEGARPEKAKGLYFLIPPGHGSEHGKRNHSIPRHKPYLSYFAEDNRLLDPPTALASSPLGREVVSLCIENCHVFFEPPYPYEPGQKASTLHWAPSGPGGGFPEQPGSPADDGYMDWLLNADDIGLKGLRPERASTVVYLPDGGDVFAQQVFRNAQSMDLTPVCWRVGQRNQAVARGIRIRLTGLWQRLRIVVTERKKGVTSHRGKILHEIELLPSGSKLLHVSISNLPGKYDGEETHLHLLKGLGCKSKIQTPVQWDDVQTIQAACDVPYKLGGESPEVLRLPPDYPPSKSPSPRYFSMIGVRKAWDVGCKGSHKVRVAIIDSGIDSREGPHRYLKNRVEWAWPLPGTTAKRAWLDETGHGTMMASIVAARHFPGNPVRGIAPKTRLLNFRVVNAGNRFPDEKSLIHTLNKLGGAERHAPVRVALLAVRLEMDDGKVSDDVFEALARYTEILFVVSAGEGFDPKPDPRLAALDHVLVVGRVDDDGRTYRSLGDDTSVHLAAPGTKVRAVSCFGLDRLSGSSASAAFVAGAAALAFAKDRNATAKEMRERIGNKVKKVKALRHRTYYGGILNIPKLLGLKKN